MSWNQVKIGLAPIGSKIFESRDRTTTTADGYPVTVLTVRPPEGEKGSTVRTSDLERWFADRGFRSVMRKSQSSRYDFQDISALIFSKGDALHQITMSFQIGFDVRSRLGTWGNLVTEVCQTFRLRLIDGEVGLVEPEAFERLVMRSFAWECFLEREKSGGKRKANGGDFRP